VGDLWGADAVRGPRVGPKVCWVRRRLVRAVAAPQGVRVRLALEPRVADAHDVAGHVGRARQVGINARAAGLNSGLRAPGGLPVGVGAVGVAARAAHTRGRDVLLVVAMVDRHDSGRLDLARGRVGPGTAELSYAVGAWVGEMVTPSGCWCVWTLLSDLFLSLNNEGIFLCQFWLATLMLAAGCCSW